MQLQQLFTAAATLFEQHQGDNHLVNLYSKLAAASAAYIATNS